MWGDLIAARQDSVHTIVEASRADIVCIQETKISAMTNRVLLSALGSDFPEFFVVPAAGASGGILVAWGDTSESPELQESIITV